MQSQVNLCPSCDMNWAAVEYKSTFFCGLSYSLSLFCSPTSLPVVAGKCVVKETKC